MTILLITVLPYSAKFSRRTIFADRVILSVSWKQYSRIKDILLATPFAYAFSQRIIFTVPDQSAKNVKNMRLENLALYGNSNDGSVPAWYPVVMFIVAPPTVVGVRSMAAC